LGSLGVASFIYCSEEKGINQDLIVGSVDQINEQLRGGAGPAWELVELRASHNYVRRLEGLQGQSGLRCLDLSLNQISDTSLKGLPLLENLVILSLSGNAIKTLSNMHRLPNLRRLDLSANCLSSISDCSLSPLSKLKVLKLNNNDLETLDGIQGCIELEALEVNNNKLTTIMHLSVTPGSTGTLASRHSEMMSDNAIDRSQTFLRASMFHLSVSNNRLSDLVEAARTVHSMPYLYELQSYDNPIDKEETYMARLLDRSRVRWFDRSEVTQHLRDQIKVKFCVRLCFLQRGFSMLYPHFPSPLPLTICT
jgi:hypothetical protein